MENEQKKVQTGRQVINRFFGLMEERTEDAYIVFFNSKKNSVDIKIHPASSLKNFKGHYNSYYDENLKRIANSDIQIVGFGAWNDECTPDSVLHTRKHLYKGKLFKKKG